MPARSTRCLPPIAERWLQSHVCHPFQTVRFSDCSSRNSGREFSSSIFIGPSQTQSLHRHTSSRTVIRQENDFALVRPLPVADLRHVLAVLADVLFVLDQQVA